MAISRQKKEELIQLYREHIENASSIVFTNYRGINVPRIHALRSKLGEVGATYMVVKNSLFKVALQQAGKDLELDGLLLGPNAVVFLGEDIGTGVKALKDWIRQEGIVEIRGAILEDSVLDARGAEALADLPTREQMLAKLLATVRAPASSLVRIIGAPGAGLVRVLQAHIDARSESAA